jgi:carbamoyltransferase
MTHILGLNSFHGDSSACLLTDGRIVAAAEEERFTRIKHWAGFPKAAIRYCLAEAGLRLEHIDRVAVNHDSRANLWPRLAYVARGRPSPGAIIERLRRRRRRSDLASHFADAFGAGKLRAPVEGIEHHECHLASAFFGSRFPEALAVSVDGFGDFASTAWGIGRDARVEVARRVLYPHSLGIFYQALTQYLGFPDYGEEYKVMGLAPYGEPHHVEALRRLVVLHEYGGFSLDLAYFRHADGNLEVGWSAGAPRFTALFSSALEDLLGPARSSTDEITQRHRDLASSVQAVYEEAFFHVLRHARERFGMESLVLAGGCAQNSVANGKIERATSIRRTYVQPASGDAGGAAGAAMAAWARLSGARPCSMDNPYLGPGFDDSQCAASLAGRAAELLREGCFEERPIDEEALCRRVAGLIAEGRVVGWFQGRMEWGPRALGNRSILCDPRRADMKHLLNAKTKRRESFRPFAPSILREAVADWFTVDEDVPFMTHVYPVRPECRARIPAVTHVDGSGRLHSVSAQGNSRFHRLISAFRDLTGIPMLLNTSFNESEPIVCTPDEALDCFLRTRMDCLVLGDRVLLRPWAGPSAIPDR